MSVNFGNITRVSNVKNPQYEYSQKFTGVGSMPSTIPQDTFEQTEQDEKEKSRNKIIGWSVAAAISMTAILVGGKYLNKHLNKDISKTFLGKIGKWGDNFSKKVSNSNFGKKVQNCWSNFKNGPCKKIDEKLSNYNFYKNTKNFFKNPSIAENSMAKAQSAIASQYVGEAQDVIEAYAHHCCENTDKTFKTMKNSERCGFVTAKMNELWGEFKKEKKLEKTLGEFREYSQFNSECMSNFNEDNRKALCEFLEYLNKNAKNNKVQLNTNNQFVSSMKMQATERWYNPAYWLKKTTERNVGLDATINKLKVAGLSEEVANTKFGRFLSQKTLYTIENFTNVTAGGVCSALFQAAIWGSIVADVVAAPPEDRGKVLAESIIVDLGSFLCMPFMVKGVNMIGGLKYWGMTDDAIKTYRTATKKAKLASMGKDYNEWKKAKDMAQEQLKTRRKIPGAIGSTLMWGRESLGIRPMKPNVQGFAKFSEGVKYGFNWVKYYCSQFLGGAFRFALGMFGIASVTSSALSKTSHAIFGTPQEALKEEEAKNTEKEQHSQKIKTMREMAELTSDAQFMEKLQNSPEVLMALQQDPEKMAMVEKHPMILKQLVEENEVRKQQLKKENPQLARVENGMQKLSQNPEFLQIISDPQIVDRLDKNQEVIYFMMQSPDLIEAIDKEPKMFIELLETVEKAKAKENGGVVAKKTNLSEQPEFSGNIENNRPEVIEYEKPNNDVIEKQAIKTVQPKEELKPKAIKAVNVQPREAKRTYIPSPYVNNSQKDQQRDEQFQNSMLKADRAIYKAQVWTR